MKILYTQKFALYPRRNIRDLVRSITELSKRALHGFRIHKIDEFKMSAKPLSDDDVLAPGWIVTIETTVRE